MLKETAVARVAMETVGVALGGTRGSVDWRDGVGDNLWIDRIIMVLMDLYDITSDGLKRRYIWRSVYASMNRSGEKLIKSPLMA